MVFLDDLRDLTMYKKSFYLPINEDNKKTGSAIFLLTPNYESSRKVMNAPYTINKRLFQSYYTERNVNYYINSEGTCIANEPDKYLHEEYILDDTNLNIFENEDNLYNRISNFNNTPDDRKYEEAVSIIDSIEKHDLRKAVFMTSDNQFAEYYKNTVKENCLQMLQNGFYEKNFSIDDMNIITNNIDKIDNRKIAIAEGYSYATSILSEAFDDDGFEVYDYNEGVTDTTMLAYFPLEESVLFKIYEDERLLFNDDTFEEAYNEVLSDYDKISNTIANFNETFEDECIVNESAPVKEIRSVSAIILNDDKSRILVEDHIRGQCLTIPGGKIDPGETPEEALVREIKEETGITVTSFRKLYDFKFGFKYIDDPDPYVATDTIYIIDSYDGKITNTEPHKHKSLKFESINYLKTRSNISKILKRLIYNVDFNRKSFANVFSQKKGGLIFSGYESDIKDAQKFLTLDRMKSIFGIIGAKFNNYDRYIMVSGMDDGYDYIDENNISILSKKVYENNYNNTYDNYIKTCICIHAYRCINPKVSDKIVYPLAIYKSGAYLKNKNAGGYYMSQLFENIEMDYGNDELINIVKRNDYRYVISLAIKYGLSSLLNESNDIVTDPDKLAGHIKRSARKASVYRHNEIKRNVEKNKPASDNVNKESFNYNTLMSNIDENDVFELENSLFVLDEASVSDAQLRKALYADRIRTSKELLDIYSRVKSDNPFIMYTYTDINRYAERNLFVDLSYYNEVYFRNAEYESIRGLNLYFDLVKRLITDKRYSNYKKRTIFIPVLDWNNGSDTKMWLYKESINPISIIYQMMRTNPRKLLEVFKDNDVVFLGAKNYFKINFSKFVQDKDIKNTTARFLILIKKMISLGYNSPAEPDPEDEPENSPKGITMNIIDKIEDTQGITINKINLLGDTNKKDSTITIKDLENKRSNPNTTKASDNKAKKNTTTEEKIKATKIDTAKSNVVNKVDTDKKKDELVDNISRAAMDSKSVDDTLDKLDDERFKKLLVDLAGEESGNVKMNAARASRALQLQKDFVDKKVNGKPIKELLATKPDTIALPTTSLNISSPNEEWKNLTFMNFDKKYDVDADIIKMLNSMKDWSKPVFVRNINVQDNSTSEDYLDLYTVECEDSNGTRFTLNFDVPKFKENRYMMLRGNKKTLLIQSYLMPIIKTDVDTCQIITNYNKIFVRRFGSSAGKSNVVTDRIVKSLRKYKGDNIKVTYGDNSRICAKYELPIDYIDLASVYDKIETPLFTLYFNQDELRKEYKVDDNLGMPYGVTKNNEVMYFKGHTGEDGTSLMFSFSLLSDLVGIDGFNEIYHKTKNSTKYMYSRASIMSIKIPLVVLAAYSEGLVSVMNKAGIKYDYVEKLESHHKNSDITDYIKFNDGYIIYTVDYNSSLLMNGLKECDTANYSIKDINSKSMYLDFLDNYGGRIKSDGFDAFYDCLIDPITKEILEKFDLPTDYVSVLMYANQLLADNKYVKHTKMDGRRFRRGELIASYVYSALTDSYSSYYRQIKHSRSKATMTIKQSVIIDMVLTDSISSDTSINNPINDVEGINTITSKGPSGMNSDRAYSLDKRTYDESMLNILGMSTGFAGNVGINRQATVDANIEGTRGFVKPIDNDTSQANTAKTLTITEALTPYGVTSDDPFRTAMTFIQTSKHLVRTDKSDPLLVTNGSDEAMPYLVSDMFAFKAKKDGKVVELVNADKNSYMIIQYKDNTYEFVDLDSKIEKNSDGGYNVVLKLDTDLKLGDTVKEGEVVAYDKKSFTKDIGGDNRLKTEIGALAKIAVINTDEGFEDSAAVDESLTRELATDIVVTKEIVLPKYTNIESMAKVGDKVKQEDTLLVFQTPYEDDDVNILLRNLAADEDEISELGRMPIKAKVTGDIVDIKVYRTCEFDEMSDSLKKFVKEYEKPIESKRKIYDKYGLESKTELPSTYKLSQTGKLKKVEDGVLIVFYIRYKDIMSVGDKVVFYSANKGVIKYIFPKGQEPYTSFRPNEKIKAFVSIGSINGRMVCSTLKYGAFSKAMVELDRSVKEMAHIPYNDTNI